MSVEESKELLKKDKSKYRADFLWPCEEGSIEQAGYEFANGLTEDYRQSWWLILCSRIAELTR